MDNILDDDRPNHSNSKGLSSFLKRHKNLLPLVLPTYIMLRYIASGWMIGIVFTLQQLLGFLLLTLTILSYFLLRRYFKFILILFIGLALFCIVNIDYTLYYFNSFQIHPLFLTLAIVYYFLNFKTINDRIMPQGNNANPEEAQQRYYLQEVEKFKQKFVAYDKAQLENIIAKEMSLKAAKEAANWLLENNANKYS